MTVDIPHRALWRDKVAQGHTPDPADNMQVALFFQGGGALGAYQAGVYAALAKAGIDADWVSGISIGAFNAAIIAGNPPQQRAEKLRGFWDRISTPHNSPALTSLLGVGGFFKAIGSGFPHGIYDVSPMEKTLRQFVDFEYLNDRSPTRLSVAAADARDPNLIVYFDSRNTAPPDHAIAQDSLLQITEKHRIGPEHILASGALPPAFPQVAVKGHRYIDAGVIDNANAPVVWAQRTGQLNPDTVAIRADLWNAPLEEQREAVCRYSRQEREKDRKYCGPSPKIGPSDVGALISLVLKRRDDHSENKDYDFSSASVKANWNAGFADMMGALETYLDPKALQGIIRGDKVDGRSYLATAIQRASSGGASDRGVV